VTIFSTQRSQRTQRKTYKTSLFSALSAGSALKHLLLLAGLLAAAGGCATPCPDSLRSIDQIVAAHNANAASVPRLWARVEMDVSLKPETGPEMTWRSGSPTSLLLYRRGQNPDGPHDFVLLGREMAAVELFRLGSSTAQGLYYFRYKFGDRAGAWYARLALAGAPGVKHMPIDPMQLLGILGITPLPDEPGKLPAVALSMNNTPGQCAYVVTVLDRQPVSNRVLFKREIVLPWTGKEPPLPTRVNIFDDTGRRVMTAALADYKPIDVSSLDDPPAKSPVMPTDIDITCSDAPGVPRLIRKIHLRLSEMTVEDKWLPEAVDFQPPTGVVPVPTDAGVDITRPGPATAPRAVPETAPAEQATTGPAAATATAPASQPAGIPASIPASAPLGGLRPAGKNAKRGEK